MALFGRDGGKEEKDARDGRESGASSKASSAGDEAAPQSFTRRDRETRSVPPNQEASMANVGKSITIKGDLTGDEDVVIEGKVEGKVSLPEHQLTVGANGICEATVHAKNVVVIGRVAGDVSAIERVEVQASGIVEGDVKSPRLIVEEGAVLNGSITMSKSGDGASARPASEKPKQSPPPGPALSATP